MSITKTTPKKLKQNNYLEDEKSIKWIRKNILNQHKSSFIREAVAEKIARLS